MNIYLVFGSTGEYSDRTEWVVGAFRSQPKAAELVVKLQALANTFDYEHRYDARQVEFAKLMAEAGDDRWHCDYTGTGYALEEVKLDEEI